MENNTENNVTSIIEENDFTDNRTLHGHRERCQRERQDTISD